MKENIHPVWFPQARVICACGNTWVTGSTVEEVRTDVCASCHPFYTGEQRVVDTEGRVDRFYKKLQARESRIQEETERRDERRSPELPVAELEIGTRYENALAEAGITTAGEIIERLQKGGDAALLDVKGFGQKGLIDLKRRLRSRGYEL